MPSDPSLPLSFLLPLLNLQSQQLARRQSQDTQDASLLFSTVVCAVLSEEELGEGGGKKSLGDIDFQLHPHAGFTKISSGKCIFPVSVILWVENKRAASFFTAVGRMKRHIALRAKRRGERKRGTETKFLFASHFISEDRPRSYPLVHT